MRPIDPARWRALSPYLDELLDLEPDERDARLTSLGAGDARLATDLHALLVEQRVLEESHFMEGAVLGLAPATTPSLAGHVVGAYRLLEPIGEGGTGSVWLAERCDGRFHGRAAVKLLNLALVGRGGEERFRREGTFLARLRHPRIAHLIDAGVSSGGQPYLVLEHVNGEPIDWYCAQRALGIESRIRVFLGVLDAVAFAHASLVVHRDIKPANVLVSVDGEVKLLDFGIAKLVDPGGEWGATRIPAMAVTREGVAAMTPEFAAPEQLAGGAVTTATDVYALGVLLYLLLSGRHPAGGGARFPAMLVRAIVDAEPPRVSDAAVSTGDPHDADPGRHAVECGTTPARLQRALRGDLDTIVAKALQKNPADRYASVTAFADDLRRVLRREPISARPDTVRYRATKFVRRHAGGVATFIATVLLIAALLAFHASRIAAERDRARYEAAKALKVSELLMGLLTAADLYGIRGAQGEPTIRSLLDAGAEQVQRELAGQPELQADMLTTMGRTYRRLALFSKSRQLLEQALASAQKTFGPHDVRVARTLHELGVALADAGDYAAAGPRLEQALAMRRALLGREHADVAVTLVELGRVYQDQGLNARAEPIQREALAIRQKVLGGEHRETAVSLSDLASVLRLEGDLDGAERLLRRCLALNRATRGEHHPNTAVTMHDLALIAAARGDWLAADTQLRRVLAVQRQALGPRHPVVAATLNSLAHVLVASGGHDDEAAELLEEALDIVRRALGNHNQLVAIYGASAASVHLARGRPEVAETLAREALRIRAEAPGTVPSRRRTLLEDDWSVSAIRSLLGAVLTAREK